MAKLKFIVTFFLLLAAGALTVIFGIVLFGNYAIDNKELVMDAATSIEDTEGNVITSLYLENRELVALDDIPEHVQHAFLAVEDHRFFDHKGVDLRSVGRAAYRVVTSGAKVEGGSTITQQLAKNVFLSSEKTWWRKIQEVLIAVNLEVRYDKEEILEMYLNRIYFGHGAHGVQAASKLYFDKHVSELTADEGALLAALPKGPNNYSPLQHPERSKERRDLVLGLMERHGYLSAEETVRLQGRTIPTEGARMTENPAYLSYVDLVLEEAEERYNLTQEEVLKGGYRIVVEMDPEIQQAAYNAFQEEGNFPAAEGEIKPDGGFVLINNETGGVLAAQGGREYVRQGFNRVTAKRQPGSVFKPLAVYAPALETGEYEPYSLLKDEKLSYGDYSPGNVDGNYRGELSMYDAVKDSANAPAVWLLNEIGLETAKDSLEKQNIVFEEEGLGIALGGLDGGVSPLDIAAAYTTFANNGIYKEPYFIKEIADRNGEIYASHEETEHEVFSPQTAWYMTRMLEAVVTEGTGQAGSYEGPLAGKTGTTQFEGISGASRDVWFAGYTPEVAGALWMGQDRTDENNYLTERSSVPTRVFKSVLTAGLAGNESLSTAFEPPEEVSDLSDPIRFVEINDLTAEVSLGWRGARVELNWSGSDDERLQYNVYEVTSSGNNKIAEVTGETSYTVQSANVFSPGSYVVVPYNPQIDREGDASNTVHANYSLFSKSEDAS
ncbi:transglycosylase domain-containing protein [Evansella clarkii]|uniref:transglycosylase domain-containing protein n=1 Tax=Evansella clarkii TaxID=79879 RepID=UPI000B43A0C2|nr:PBP1A family penicillin-binding protein [Evansella clarkii]